MTSPCLHLLGLLVLLAPLLAAPRAAVIPGSLPAPGWTASRSRALVAQVPFTPPGRTQLARPRRPSGPGLMEAPHGPAVWSAGHAVIPTSRVLWLPLERFPGGPAPLAPYTTTLPPPALG